MSKISVGAEECVALGAAGHVLEAYPNREVAFGTLQVARALPIKERRMVGPWCFLDRFGPKSFGDEKPMDVAPHPHTGLQTVTWLVEGEVLHDDSLGCESIARPGGLNVMTAGKGISHAEQTPKINTGILNGVQLWVALPNETRHIDPNFQALEEVPTVELPGGLVQVFSGALANLTSTANHYSELVGADVQVHPGEQTEFGLDPRFEHAVLILNGDCTLEGQVLEEKTLYYLGTKRSEIQFHSREGCRILLIGGPPFPEAILMWWNFVGRTPEEIAQFRADWVNNDRFGEVTAYDGPRLRAPELINLARPNPVS